jgi:exodeoxyribonuclease V alpha subunit
LEIKGEITEIIYRNEINSYMIAVFENEEEETTIVGYLPFIQKGDTLKVVRQFYRAPRIWKTV